MANPQTDPRRLQDAKDASIVAAYAKRTTGSDVYPLRVDSSGYLLVNQTAGTVTVTGTVTTSVSTTLSTIDNTPTVLLSSTTTKVTIDNTPTVSLSSTLTTIDNEPTVALSTTLTTIDNNITLSDTNVTINLGRTFTGASGSLAATDTTIVTATNKAKVYAFSLTTTSATEVICIWHSNGLELWRVSLLAPSGANSGANLAVPPPAYLFSSYSATGLSLSISTTDTVHYSLSYFDEA